LLIPEHFVKDELAAWSVGEAVKETLTGNAAGCPYLSDNQRRITEPESWRMRDASHNDGVG